VPVSPGYFTSPYQCAANFRVENCGEGLWQRALGPSVRDGMCPIGNAAVAYRGDGMSHRARKRWVADGAAEQRTWQTCGTCGEREAVVRGNKGDATEEDCASS